jgi:hypothetical protein
MAKIQDRQFTGMPLTSSVEAPGINGNAKPKAQYQPPAGKAFKIDFSKISASDG